MESFLLKKSSFENLFKFLRCDRQSKPIVHVILTIPLETFVYCHNLAVCAEYDPFIFISM